MSALAARGWQRLAPRWLVPMHYRTGRARFLEEPADAFLASFGDAVHRAGTPELDTAGLPPAGGPLAVVPAVP